MFLVRFILLVIFLYLIFRIIILIVIGLNRKKNMRSDSGNQYSHSRKDGHVTVNFKSSDKSKKISKDEGEYVNFEEIKDE